MVWFKVDDALAFHPKTLRAGNAAMGLWVRAGSWSAQQLTNGLIPDSILPSLGTVKQAQALVAAGLWRRADGAWSFHEWNADGRQPTRESVEAERAAARERQRKHREQKEASRRDSTVTNGVSNGEVTGGVTPTPTRPDPTRPSISNEIDGVPRKRATRIPDPFIVTKDMRDWAAGRTPLVAVDDTTERFVNYWRAKAGRDATKLDWLATWQNWLLRDQDDRSNRKLTPTARAQQTAAAGRKVAGQQITTLEPKEIE